MSSQKLSQVTTVFCKIRESKAINAHHVIEKDAK
jgi:hypothetical protein